MKKFLSLLCAAVLVLSASAAPFAKVAKKDFRKVAKLPKIENLESQRITTPLFKDFKAISKAPAAKQDVAAPFLLQAVFYGAYNDAVNGSEGDMSWTLTFLGGADTTYVGAVSITTVASNKIAGEYEVTTATGEVVFAAGDTAAVSGAIRLTATGADTYHVELSAVDAQNREWNIDAELEVLAIDFLTFVYAQYGYANMSDAIIDLKDFKIEPNGVVKNVLVDLPNVTEYTSDVMYEGYSADQAYYVQLDFAFSDTIKLPHELAYEDFLMNYTKLYDMNNGGLAIRIDTIWDATLSESGDTLVIDAKLLCVDSIQYNIHMLSYEPEVQDTIRHSFARQAVVQEQNQFFYFGTADAEYLVMVGVIGSYAAGDYTLADDIYGRYTYLAKINGTDTTTLDYLDLKVAITAGDDAYAIQVECLAKDKNYYIFNMAAAKPIEVVPVDMTFSFAQTDSTIVITPSNLEEPFDFVVLPKANYDAAVFKSNADTVAAYAYQQKGDQYAVTGVQVVSFDALRKQGASGEIVLVVYGCNHGVTTPAAAYTFGLYPQGIENAEDGAKAVKRFENGQLIIEKNGIKYNALGVRL